MATCTNERRNMSAMDLARTVRSGLGLAMIELSAMVVMGLARAVTDAMGLARTVWLMMTGALGPAHAVYGLTWSKLFGNCPTSGDGQTGLRLSWESTKQQNHLSYVQPNS